MSRCRFLAVCASTALLLAACIPDIAEGQGYQFGQRGPSYFDLPVPGYPVEPFPRNYPNPPWYGQPWYGGHGYGNRFDGNRYGYGGYNGFEPRGPSLYSLDHGPRQALKQGCMDRYGDHTSRYQACVEGERHSADALVDGCTKRYQGNPEKIRRCLGM